jgi:hypothetical protein
MRAIHSRLAIKISENREIQGLQSCMYYFGEVEQILWIPL